MSPYPDARRIAVLIDAENVAASTINRVIREIDRFGRPVLRRAYGDFNGPQAAVWEQVFAREGHRAASSVRLWPRGKNAADIALVIDAMDLLHSGEFDGFCIVSTDSDFMRLAIRIREQNLPCYVFGGVKTQERFRRACTRFVYLENLRYDVHNGASHTKMKPLRPMSDALLIVRTIISSLAAAPGDWGQLDLLERELERQTTDFDTRSYGYLRLRDLLLALKRPVIVDASRDGVVRVRLRVRRSKPKSTTNTAADPSGKNQLEQV